MDIDAYVARFKPEWLQLDRACSRGSRGLGKLGGEELAEVIRLYGRVNVHLTEAQARYGDPELSAYLNGLVSRARGAIYGAEPQTMRGIFAVFGSRYRQALRGTAPFILVAAFLLVIVTGGTAVWVAGSREARAGLVPPVAQQAAQRAGGEGDQIPRPSANLSTMILFNNVGVAFLAFAAGITLGIGTIFVLVRNAAFIGLLAGAFQAAGHSWRFWSLVLPHGILELTAICISAGAGLRMGWSLIEPGERTRSQALAEEARAAALVVIGVIPAFAAAAAIEGLLTPSPVPGGIKIAAGFMVAGSYVLFLIGRKGVRGVPAP